MRPFAAAIAAAAVVLTTANAHAYVVSAAITAPFVALGSGDGSGYQDSKTIAGSGMTITMDKSGGKPFSGLYSGNAGTTATAPVAGNANYLAAQPGGSISIAFGSAQTGLALLWGSIDPFNSLSFSLAGKATADGTITGANIAAALPGVPADGKTTQAVQISGLAAFDTVVVRSTSSAFEFVPGTAVPEPLSLAILGAGLVALGMGRRKRT